MSNVLRVLIQLLLKFCVPLVKGNEKSTAQEPFPSLIQNLRSVSPEQQDVSIGVEKNSAHVLVVGKFLRVDMKVLELNADVCHHLDNLLKVLGVPIG